jgi:hypothetical protein
VADDTDNFRTALSGTATSWTAVDQTTYLLSNTSSTSSDGWRTYGGWAETSQATYEANNVDKNEGDNYRTTVVAGHDTWTEVTKAQFTASNESNTGTNGDSDGWRSFKAYSEPYDSHENSIPATIKNYATIGNLVVSNTSGVEGNFTPALRQNDNGTPQYGDDTGPYTNAAAADLFVQTDFSDLGTALASVALEQCGGTVTVQTKIGSTSAQDPFTYENVATHETVQTSALYRSGTFDVALPGGSSTSVTISPQDFTNLTHFSPAGWTCKSAGSPYPFTVVPVEGHAPWTAVQMTVNPNQAVSCVQQVTSP